MRRMLQISVYAGVALLAAQLSAGGFFVELGNPAANPEAEAKGAVLVARISGCHDPAKATITGVAEGRVDGRGQSVPLALIPLSQPGTYAVTKQWPAEGVWAVKLIAQTDGLTTSAIVRMTADGFDRASAKYFRRAPENEEVRTLLAAR